MIATIVQNPTTTNMSSNATTRSPTRTGSPTRPNTTTKEFSILRKVRSQLSLHHRGAASFKRRQQETPQNFDPVCEVNPEENIDTNPASLALQTTKHQQGFESAPITLVEGDIGEDLLGDENNNNNNNDNILLPRKCMMKKSVSFSTFNSINRVPSRLDLFQTSNKEEIWFERTDFSRFAQEEMSRRGSLGITSTSALDSSVPAHDEHTDDDDNDSDSDSDSSDDDMDIGLSF
ncbi:hypothetical protein FRACYDRAFT_246111 [Fragilariopsis cylindrus CCMP1102]|uniref:Uncharacterized protein n=1 Tax=Fragilariopsis cylindrus CCMP1102 TaxID=635003 RepID=A0A1E7EYC6_9STRA|nr:hypothetical protein FRACYDRAFT_246111 [Fragilariopsis cylindrus CCMP1102]|eukprot:OEU11010.1 hypothetical protein FRACYDRAFT_246111 [Fragilariopsis cylindrus CCMP1102]